MVLASFLSFCIYFSPTVVAMLHDHPRAGTIFLVNLCFGWTLLGWVVAMVWAWMGGKSVD
jgi:hypothetical protein